MGKGAGCGQSKTSVPDQKLTEEVVKAPVAAEKEVVETKAKTTPSGKMTKKIYIVFYSTYGHIYKLAQTIKEGIDSVDGVEGILYQVPETLPEDVLAKMHAPPKPDVPIIDVHTLPDADGFVFGFPTRFGSPAAQFKAFLDSTGQLWQKGSLVGKPVTMFTSTASQGGGQEVTIMNTMSFVAAHGLIYVPPGYSHGAALFGVDEVRGGGPWGAGTFAGVDGSRQPTETELGAAKHQGAYFAGKALLLAA